MTKKLFIILLSLVFIILLCIYIFIPENIEIRKSFIAKITPEALSRLFLQKEKRDDWMKNNGNNILHIQNSIATAPSEINMELLFNKQQFNALLIAQTLSKDSVLLNWSTNLMTTSSPIDKIRKYITAVKLKKALDKESENLAIFVKDPKNVYGFTTRIMNLTDSDMITIKNNTDSYPTLTEIYSKINILINFAKEHNATPTNYPMLNIQRTGDNKFRYMVALPINNQILGTGEIENKKMLAKGYFLTSDSLYGGMAHIDSLFTQWEYYKEDYGYVSPAIPFQSLITDRMKEPDSSKWITKFYYPIY